MHLFSGLETHVEIQLYDHPLVQAYYNYKTIFQIIFKCVNVTCFFFPCEHKVPQFKGRIWNMDIWNNLDLWPF